MKQLKRMYDLIRRIGVDSNSENVQLKTSELSAKLIQIGSAKRTAMNILTPSRAGSGMNVLVQTGLVQKLDRGVWILSSMKSLEDLVRPKKPPKRPAIQKFKGTRPRGIGWDKCVRLGSGDCENSEWRLFRKESRDGAFKMKLVHLGGKANSKANFYLSCKNGIMVNGRDYLLLMTHRPNLAEELRLFVYDDYKFDIGMSIPNGMEIKKDGSCDDWIAILRQIAEKMELNYGY